MSCSQTATKPDNVLYVFSSGPILEKKQNLITITAAPHWTDAQVQPPEDFDWSPLTVLISDDDFADLWATLQAIDLSHVKNPGDDAYDVTPPDVNHVERLRFEVNDTAWVRWSFDGGHLKPEYRSELDSLNERLRETHMRRYTDPVIPTAMTLLLEETQENRTDFWELVKDGTDLTIKTSAMSQANPVPLETTKGLMILLQDVRIIGRTYSEFAFGEDTVTAASTCHAVLELNGITAADFAITGNPDDKHRFDRLREMLARLSGQ